KPLAEQPASAAQRATRARNELNVLLRSSALDRSTDSRLTTKMKTQMLTDQNVPGPRLQVTSEDRIVYPLGPVTRREFHRAPSRGQGVSGVQRIVKPFENID